MSFEIRPLNNMGAEIVGIDSSREIPEDTAKALYDAWLKYGILVFRNAARSHQEHLRLSHVFGPSTPCEMSDLGVKDEPELILVSGEGKYKGPGFIIDGEIKVGWLFWHQDESYTTDIPQGSMLRMTTVPQVEGETGFLHIARAYADLPEKTKRRIENLEVKHRLQFRPEDIRFGVDHARTRMARQDEYEFKQIEMQDFEQTPTVHPLVVTRPDSNQKSMLLSPLTALAVLGLPPQESDDLLHELAAHVLRDQYVYKHRWQENDCVVWDNWTVMHCGCGYPPEEHRMGYRTTFMGKTGKRSGRLYKAAQEAA